MPDNLQPPTPPAPPEEQEVYCFQDAARPCTAECIAYEATSSADKDLEGKAWRRCMILLNVHRGGKHLVVLASTATRVANQAADHARQNPTPPPRPA